MSQLRERLPTPEQIGAMTDLQSVDELRNVVELAAKRIETDLEFDIGSDEWARRARNALALHRHVARQLARRAGVLRQAQEVAAKRRPEEACDPLTLEVLREHPTMDVEAIPTIEEVDAKVAWLELRFQAIARDRDDEKSLDVAEFDHAFLGSTKAALKALTVIRLRLEAHRRNLVKVARLAAEAEQQRSREHLFIEVCRERMPRETFLAAWAEVDRRLGERAAA